MKFNLSRVGSRWGRSQRNNVNDNWAKIEKVINDRGVEILSEQAFLDWLYENGIKHAEEVQRFSDLPTGDSLNTVRGVYDDNKIYIKKENGWVPFQTIDISKINEVETMAIERTNEFGVSIKKFGAIGDHRNDDTQSISDTIHYVGTNGGGVVYIPDGDFVITDTVEQPYDNVYIKGQGRSSRLIPSESMKTSDTDAKWAVKLGGNNPSLPKTMTNNGIGTNELARKGHVWIGLNNTDGIEVNDLVHIVGSTQTSLWENDHRGYLVKGEANLVVDVDTAGKRIRVFKPLSDTWAANEIAHVTSIKPLLNAGIEGVSVVGDESKLYRGIEVFNSLRAVIKDCYTDNCGIVGINSRRSFNNTIINPYVERSWIGDIKVSDQAILGLCYGIRLTEDTLSTIIDGAVLHARHTIDISGTFPSRACVVDGTILTQLSDAGGNLSTHSTAEGCIFRNLTLNNGSYGVLNRGVRNTFHNIKTIGTPVGFFEMGLDSHIHTNEFDGYIRWTTPEKNNSERFMRIKNNTFKSNQILYIVANGDKAFTHIYNLEIDDNTVLSSSIETQQAFIFEFSGAEKVTFMDMLSFKNNAGRTANGVIYPLPINKDKNSHIFDRWLRLESDSIHTRRRPVAPIPGQMMFHSEHNKAAWFNGDIWVDAMGNALPDDI